MSRAPRSPEPQGSHTFVGAIPTNRLNPTPVYEHPDPFTLGTLTITGVLTAAALTVTGSTTTSTITASGHIQANSTLSVVGTFTANTGSVVLGSTSTTSLTSSGHVQVNSTLTVTGATTMAGATVNSTLLVVGTTTMGTVNITTLNTVTTGTITNLTTNDLEATNSSTSTIGETTAFLSVKATTVKTSTLDDTGGGSIALAANITISGSLNLSIGSSGTDDQLGSIHVEDIHVYDNLDMKDNPLHGINNRGSSNPVLADMEIGEIQFGDTGAASATSGRIWIKVDANQIFGFISDARIVI